MKKEERLDDSHPAAEGCLRILGWVSETSAQKGKKGPKRFT